MPLEQDKFSDDFLGQVTFSMSEIDGKQQSGKYALKGADGKDGAWGHIGARAIHCRSPTRCSQHVACVADDALCASC